MSASARHLSPAPPEPGEEPPWGELDDGIRETVRALWSAGFLTTDSGDGRRVGVKADMECVLDVPHVFMVCDPAEMISEAHRLRDLVESWGDRFASPDPRVIVQATYSPTDGLPLLELYGALL